MNSLPGGTSTTLRHGASRDRGGARRRLIAVGAALAVALGAGIAVAPSASAVSEEQVYALSGTLSIGAPPALTLPAGSSFTATVDTETGAVTDGRTAIPTFTRAPATGVPANITITDAAPATGTLDPATGEASLALSLDVAIEVPSLSATCSLGPVDVEVTTTGGAPVTGDPATGTLVAQGFSVPGVVAGTGCPQDTADAINDVLGLPTVETAISLTVVRGEVTPPPPPVPPVVPEPVPLAPAFTG